MSPKRVLMRMLKRRMGILFLSMFFFGAVWLPFDDSPILEQLKAWPVYGVFIIPAIVGLIMLAITDDEVAKIHGRFNTIDKKLGKLDDIETKLGKLDDIETKLGKLDDIETKLGKLDDIETKLGKLDKLDKLDDIETVLKQIKKILEDKK